MKITTDDIVEILKSNTTVFDLALSDIQNAAKQIKLRLEDSYVTSIVAEDGYRIVTNEEKDKYEKPGCARFSQRNIPPEWCDSDCSEMGWYSGHDYEVPELFDFDQRWFFDINEQTIKAVTRPRFIKIWERAVVKGNAFEVGERQLPYFQRPNGAGWVVRKPVEGDEFLGMFLNECSNTYTHAAVVSIATFSFRYTYRWCRPEQYVEYPIVRRAAGYYIKHKDGNFMSLPVVGMSIESVGLFAGVQFSGQKESNEWFMHTLAGINRNGVVSNRINSLDKCATVAIPVKARFKI